jgi:hypothetical protein
MPMGTLMKKTARHPAALVSRPPNRTPAAMPLLAIAPQTDRASWRCRPLYVVMTIAMAAGVSIAAPTPCTPRETTSVLASLATPLASDASVKALRPVRNTARRSSRSASRPPSSRRPPLHST